MHGFESQDRARHLSKMNSSHEKCGKLSKMLLLWLVMDVLLIENFMEDFRANFNGMIWSLSIESSTDNSCVFTEA